MRTPKDLAAMVKKLRQESQLSQRIVAERAGLTPLTIVNTERPATCNPKMSTLLALAEALGAELVIEFRR